MTIGEKWNLIVDQYKGNINKPENIVQGLWESYCTEFLGYSKLLGECTSHISLQIGSTERIIPDIILKKNDEYVFDIELKQYNMAFSGTMEEQLKSYMNQLHLSVGMLVFQKIYLYHYDYNKNKMDHIVIEFEKDNEDGICLLELLQKDSFDKVEISNYINKRLSSVFNKQKTKEELLGDGFLDKVVEEYFLKKYPKEDIREVLSDYTLNVIKKGGVTPSNDFPTSPKFVIIKIRDDRINFCHGNIYDATRYCWRVTYDKVIKYPYVLAVKDKKVIDVYKVFNWKPAVAWDPKDNISGRLEFTGEVAEDSIRNLWINKVIPEKYRKMGMASPIVYSDIKE